MKEPIVLLFFPETISSVQKVGPERFKNEVPPGFMDAGKSENSKVSPVTTIRGHGFQRQFGDLLIWEQIISHAAVSKVESIVFVTDDKKKDWFWIESGRVVGPRPELREEIRRRAGVEFFHIYSSARFVMHANSFLRTGIDRSSVEKIRSIAAAPLQLLGEGASSSESERLRIMSFCQRLYGLPPSIDKTEAFDWVIISDDGQIDGFIMADTANVETVYRFLYRRLRRVVRKFPLDVLGRVTILLHGRHAEAASRSSDLSLLKSRFRQLPLSFALVKRAGGFDWIKVGRFRSDGFGNLPKPP